MLSKINKNEKGENKRKSSVREKTQIFKQKLNNVNVLAAMSMTEPVLHCDRFALNANACQNASGVCQFKKKDSKEKKKICSRVK